MALSQDQLAHQVPFHQIFLRSAGRGCQNLVLLGLSHETKMLLAEVETLFKGGDK
jgi:hypothetical protein